MQFDCFVDRIVKKQIASGGWISQLSLPASFASTRTRLTAQRMHRGHVYEAVLGMDVNKVTDADGFFRQGLP